MRCLLFAVRCLLPVVCWPFFGCGFLVARCSLAVCLLVASCVLFVRCVLIVVCCLLCVVRGCI